SRCIIRVVAALVVKANLIPENLRITGRSCVICRGNDTAMATGGHQVVLRYRIPGKAQSSATAAFECGVLNNPPVPRPNHTRLGNVARVIMCRHGYGDHVILYRHAVDSNARCPISTGYRCRHPVRRKGGSAAAVEDCTTGAGPLEGDIVLGAE